MQRYYYWWSPQQQAPLRGYHYGDGACYAAVIAVACVFGENMVRINAASSAPAPLRHLDPCIAQGAIAIVSGSSPATEEEDTLPYDIVTLVAENEVVDMQCVCLMS